MEAADHRFEISEDASALIRARRGQLWIWPDLDRRPRAALFPPAFHKDGWSTYARDGLAIHVDSAIVPPKRWVVSMTPDRVVEVRWDGLSPTVLGRVPLVRAEPEPSEHPSSPLAHVRRILVVPVLAWVFAVLWALRFVGVSSGWLWAGRTALLGALTIAALAARVWEKITDSADASLG